MKNYPDFIKSVSIDAGANKIWQAISSADFMKKWMLDEELEINVGSVAGDPFIVKGNLHWVPFENRGFVLHSDQGKRFSYSHLSSLSGLKDIPQNYSIVDFNIITASPGTILELRLSNFPTESIYKHLVFYWSTTLGLLKTFIEKS